MDLVHAQKVFVYLEFYATAGYLEEMARVVRPGGALRSISYRGLSGRRDGPGLGPDGSIYRPVPRVWAVEFMQRRGLTLCGSHFVPLPPATAELLVFRRD